MLKTRLISILLTLVLFVQIPIYAGAEMQLKEQEVKSSTELMDVTEYINSYIPSEDFGVRTIAGSNIQPMETDLDLPAKYDSREKGYITRVKNQGSYGTCWAFGAISAMEANINKQGLYQGTRELDLSEMHLAYSFYNRKDDPLGNTAKDKNFALEKSWLDRGGNSISTVMHLAQWSDPLTEEQAPYSRIPTESDEYGSPGYKLKNAIIIPENDINAIKYHIMKYGAVSASYFANYNEFAYNPPYFYSFGAPNHAISIVGWDDTVKKESFKGTTKPSKDGVWIVKNSWGERGSENGYFYMSQSQNLSEVIAYECMPGDEYDYNYFYDGSSDSYYALISGHNLQAANIFEAKKGDSKLAEYIKGVSVCIASSNADCEVQIYTNLKSNSDPESGTPMLSAPAKISVDYQGVYTVPLGEKIEIKKGTKFSVVATIKNHKNSGLNSSIYIAEDSDNPYVKTEEYTEPNQSFLKVANEWEDLHGYLNRERCARIRALTVVENDERKSVSDGNITLDTSEYTYSGNECKPKATVVVDGKKLTETVDYKVTYSSNIEAGNATVRVSGINNYKDEKDLSFKINSLPLTEEMVSSIGNQTYTINGSRPTVTVKQGTKTLLKNNDYDVTYSNNSKVGTGTVTVTGKKNYSGSVKRTFEILPCKLTESMVNDIEAVEYTGQSIKPSVKVFHSSAILSEGTDYTVSYGENVNVGKGTVIISGTGNYTGNITKEFQILEPPKTYYSIKASAKSGGSITPSGEISVEEGESQSFNIIADDGYFIDDVKIDGKSIGAVTEYTFTNVNSIHTIEADFKAPVKAERIELSENEITMKEGENHTLTAKVKPDDALDKSLLWESSDKDVVSVNGGVLTAKKAGIAVITVKSLDGSKVTASCKVTVTELNNDKNKAPSSDSKPSNNSTKPKSPSNIKQKPINANKSTSVIKVAKIKKVKLIAKKKKLNVSWKKVSGATGYEVLYAANNKFTKNKKTVKVKKNKATLKNLKAKKKYFIKVRVYKKVKGDTYYGEWSRVVKKKTK